MLCLWSSKGGAGCSVSAAAVALLAAARGETLLVDLAGEQSAVLGLTDDGGVGLGEWLRRPEPPPPDALARLERTAGAGLRLLSVVAPGPDTTDPSRVALLAELLAGDPRTVVVDLGRWNPQWTPVLERSEARILVTRLCYLALRAAADGPTPTGVVVVSEFGRALGPVDVRSVVDAPVLVTVPVDPAVSRVVDAGLLAARLPRPLRRLGALLPTQVRP